MSKLIQSTEIDLRQRAKRAGIRMMSDWDIPEYQELEDFAWDRMEVGDLRGATDAALKAIKLEPDTIDSYVILAQAAGLLGQKQA